MHPDSYRDAKTAKVEHAKIAKGMVDGLVVEINFVGHEDKAAKAVEHQAAQDPSHAL